MSKTYVFPVPDISCASCVDNVNHCLHDGMTITSGEQTITILKAKANFIDRTLTVTVDEDGLDPSVVVALLNTKLDDIGLSCSEAPPVINFLPGLTGVISGLVLLLFPLIVGPIPVAVMALVGVASVGLTLALGMDSYKKALKLLVNERKLHMDTLFSVSTLTAMIVSIAAFFVPGLPMMFEAGLLIFGFRHIGEAIRESLEQRMQLKARFQDRAPKTVKKIHPDGRVVETPIHEINKGDLVLIEAGTIVPVDGICEAGTGFIDTAIDSGSLNAEQINPGDRCLAGMQLDTGSIHMRVRLPASQSLLARKDASVAASLEAKEKASWETDADKILHYFIPTVFALAIVSGVVAGCFFSPGVAIQCAVSVLVSACPCTLGLVTGMAVKVGMMKAAHHKMEFKSTRKLEEVAQIQHVVFDLNGTLTTRTPVVSSATYTDENFFNYVLTLEQHSPKSIAKAMRQYALDKKATVIAESKPRALASGIPLPDGRGSDSYSHRSGVSAQIQGETYVLGNRQMMMEHGIAIDDQPIKSDQSIIYLARDKTILGHMILTRPLRSEAIDVVHALKKMGKQVHLCTGSDEKTARAYAYSLGISADQVRFKMTSHDKVDYVKSLQANHQRVAMIGDEENDADAITASDFGVAMPTDGDVNMTRQLADAVSRIDSLKPIVAAFEVSQQTAANIRQNLIFSLSYNIAAMLLPAGLLLATGIALNPGVGVALMIFQTSLILLNTYRFKQQDLVCLKQAGSSYAVMNSLNLTLPNSRGLTAGPRDLALAQDLWVRRSSRGNSAECGNSAESTTNHNTNIPGILDSVRFTNGYG